MSERVKFAIIGTGMIAERHAAALGEIDNAELYAVYDKNRERAAQFAKDDKLKVYNTFEELLRDPQLNAVTIATPTGAHAEIAVPCAEAKKPELSWSV